MIFFRTHFISDAVISEYKKLKASLCDNEELIMFIDNSSGFLNIDDNNLIQTLNFNGIDIKCFLYNHKVLRTNKLPTDIASDNQLAKNLMWYCSDYPFYIIRNVFPNYDFYWSFEYDVFCNGKSYRIFFDKYNDNSDFIVSHYRNLRNDPDWYWKINTDWVYNQTEKFACFFPVVRLSAKAIDFLYNKRIEQESFYKTFENKEAIFWPFCEIFVPTELTNNGFSVKNIDSEKLRFAPVYNLNIERIFENPDYKLYHPVK